MKKTAIFSFLFLCCCILLSCNNRKVIVEKEKYITPNTEEVVEAYIYAKNIELWNSVLIHTKRYNEVVGKKIRNDEELELYREEGKETYTYYFKGNEKIKEGLLKNRVVQFYISLRYNIVKKTWETKFATKDKNDMEKLVSQGKVEFIGKIKVAYPNSYFPKIEVSDYKKNVLATIKEYMEILSNKTLKKGEYQIIIRDFSEADVGTDVMIKNDEGEICVIPITFVEQEGIEFSVGAQINVLPEFKKDYRLGGINYSELFSKLSVEQYNYQEVLAEEGNK